MRDEYIYTYLETFAYFEVKNKVIPHDYGFFYIFYKLVTSFLAKSTWIYNNLSITRPIIF